MSTPISSAQLQQPWSLVLFGTHTAALASVMLIGIVICSIGLVLGAATNALFGETLGMLFLIPTFALTVAAGLPLSLVLGVCMFVAPIQLLRRWRELTPALRLSYIYATLMAGVIFFTAGKIAASIQ